MHGEGRISGHAHIAVAEEGKGGAIPFRAAAPADVLHARIARTQVREVRRAAGTVVAARLLPVAVVQHLGMADLHVRASVRLEHELRHGGGVLSEIEHEHLAGPHAYRLLFSTCVAPRDPRRAVAVRRRARRAVHHVGGDRTHREIGAQRDGWSSEVAHGSRELRVSRNGARPVRLGTGQPAEARARVDGLALVDAGRADGMTVHRRPPVPVRRHARFRSVRMAQDQDGAQRRRKGGIVAASGTVAARDLVAAPAGGYDRAQHVGRAGATIKPVSHVVRARLTYF